MLRSSRCVQPVGTDGSERRAACHQRCSDPRQSRSLGGICRRWSARRLRFSGYKVIPCRRSGAGSVDPPRRSPVSCGATQRHSDLVGDHGTLLQLKIKRSTDQLLRHLEQLLGQRDQLFRRQTAVPLVHRLCQRIGNSRAHPDRRCQQKRARKSRDNPYFKGRNVFRDRN